MNGGRAWRGRRSLSALVFPSASVVATGTAAGAVSSGEASGQTIVFVGGARPTGIYRSTEAPILDQRDIMINYNPDNPCL